VTERLQGAMFRRSPAGAVALTLVGVGLGTWGVINSPIFGTESIRVEGVRQLDGDEVRRLAGVPPGANLLRLSMGTVAGAVERSPWVLDATAGRSLPGTLVITVVERRAVGWFEDPQGRAVVAADGTILERVGTPPGDLPALGIVPDPVPPGARLAQQPVSLRVASSFSPALLPAVESVGVVGDEVVLGLRSGARIQYGPAAGLDDKNHTIEEMLAWAEERGVAIASIDVRVPGAPALLPERSP
jgi:cell division septal protein FtsQ